MGDRAWFTVLVGQQLARQTNAGASRRGALGQRCKELGHFVGVPRFTFLLFGLQR